MTPLRYWLGEKVVYGKSGAKGMWVVENWLNRLNRDIII